MTDTYLHQGQHFGIRELPASSHDKVAEWMSRDEYELFMTSAGLKMPVTTEKFDAYRNASNESNGGHKFYAFHWLESGDHVGHFELKAISSEYRNATLAHVLLGAQELRGLGYGAELVRLMVDYSFSELGLYRLGASVHTCNATAITAYLKGGFVVEGLIRDVLEYKESRYSLYQMSILRHEWQSQ